MNCPKCDEEMEHVDYDPDVGIMTGGYQCDCGGWVDDYDIDDAEEPPWRDPTPNDPK